MANIVPGCIWRPIAIDYSKWPKRRKGRGLMGHIAVSDSPDLRGNPAGNCWTFYLPFVGPAIQQIDLDYVSGAAKAGDATMATFESQGGTGTTADANRSTWNDNQLNWAARILRHMHDTEGVPLQVMPDSRPESRGFATHRLGIDPYRVAGGEVWSRSYAKACPGDARHAQRFEIVRRAQALAGGTTPITPSLGDPDMRLVRTPDMSIYFVTDIEVRPVSNLALAGAASKAWGAFTEILWPELDALSADADARRARYNKPLVDLLVGGNTDGENNFHWLAKQIAAASISGAQLDPAALAAALKDALGDQLAADVAARLTVSAKPA